ncbi:MAG: hypothetical protein JWP58_329 [Hymenobacter sp.]|nr:hypothetical protein [Hymenobacter sp.]
MQTKYLFALVSLFSIASCNGESDDSHVTKIVSSKGEALYVKSYNWGITGDKQISTISDNDDPLEFGEKNEPHIVKGLDPFIYRFEHDTLIIYSRIAVNPFSVHCPSIVIQYKIVDNPDYMDLYQLIGSNTYHVVPEYSKR